MKINFTELFNINNQAISAKVTIKLEDIIIKNGEFFDGCITINGIEIYNCVGRDFDVIQIKDIYILKGIY